MTCVPRKVAKQGGALQGGGRSRRGAGTAGGRVPKSPSSTQAGGMVSVTWKWPTKQVPLKAAE